ncbi:MAG: TIGR02206 family membrane protein [Butyricicoccus sp.]
MFVWGTQVPPDSGFAHFGAYHLGWLLLSVLLCILPVGTRWEKAVRQRAAKGFTVWMGASELLRLAILARLGCLSVHVLPLHLCGMAVWLCLLHAWTGADWLGQILYILCLPGAVSALLFPDWTAYPPWNYFCIHSFAIHSAVVCYVVRQTRSRTIVPRFRGIGQAAAFLCVIVPPMFVFNRAFGTNYLFLCAAPDGSPLVLLWQWLGANGYLVGYAAAILLLMIGMLALYRGLQSDMCKKRTENS